MPGRDQDSTGGSSMPPLEPGDSVSPDGPLAPYGGRWVALIGDRVVGVGQSAEAARLAARHNRPRERLTDVRFVADNPVASTVDGKAGERVAAGSTRRLPIAVFDGLFPPDSPAAAVWAFLQTRQQPVHLVGGCVRDLLLDRPTNDLDVAVPSGGIALARSLADALGGAFVLLDAERDAARAVLKGGPGASLYVDVAGWRAGTLAGDLALRDFTVNALALNLQSPTPTVIDVTGGLEDLDRRLVRVAASSAVADDPVRGLRAVRLLAELTPYGFRLEEETAGLLRAHAHLLATISPERVRDELVRILDADTPAAWLRLMANMGQLAAVLPEAEALRGVGQSRPHHWDVFEHTVRVVDFLAWQQAWLDGRALLDGWPQQDFDRALATVRAPLAAHFQQRESAARSRRSMIRWAGLCHDWGKPATRTQESPPEPPRTRFFGHEAVGAALVAGALRRLRFNDAEVRRVAVMVANHMRPAQLAEPGEQPSRRAVYRYFRDTGDAGVDVALLSLADHLATHGPDLDPARWQVRLGSVARLLADYFKRREARVSPEPLLNGNDVMAALALKPGPLIGRILDAISEAQATGEVSTRAEAMAYLRRYVDEIEADVT